MKHTDPGRVITWTTKLAEAVQAVAEEKMVHPFNTADVRQRAAEMRNVNIGYVVKPHQMDFIQCLRSRLDITRAVDSHVRFERAWEEVCTAP